MIVKIDKEKFKKTLGEYIKSDSDGVHPNVYHEIVELLDQATVKDGQEEDREECSYCGGDNSEIEHTHQQPNKPTPEPEECEHEWIPKDVSEFCLGCGKEKSGGLESVPHSPKECGACREIESQREMKEAIDGDTRKSNYIYQLGKHIWDEFDICELCGKDFHYLKCKPRTKPIDVEKLEKMAESINSRTVPEPITNKQRIELSKNTAGQRELLRLICNRYNDLVSYLKEKEDVEAHERKYHMKHIDLDEEKN